MKTRILSAAALLPLLLVIVLVLPAWATAALFGAAAAIAAALIKRVVAHPFGVITLSVVLAGAVGNLIDRALFGFVTDMFNLQFMHFAVFNVADICVVCGGIAFCVYFLFFYDKLEKKEAPDDSHPAEG